MKHEKHKKYDKYDKYDKYNNKNEAFFKNLASSYAEKSGNELKKELVSLNGYENSGSSSDSYNLYNRSDYTLLDKKIKGRIRAAKIKKWTSRLLPVTACFIIFIMYIFINTNMPALDYPSDSNFNSADSAGADSVKSPSDTLTYEFISNKLPTDYILRKVDYDRQKAIYYIISINNVEIILTVEEFAGNINTEGLERISINNTNAYGISKEDFSFIQYIKEDFLYILTSPYDGYQDLIKISENLI